MEAEKLLEPKPTGEEINLFARNFKASISPGFSDSGINVALEMDADNVDTISVQHNIGLTLNAIGSKFRMLAWQKLKTVVYASPYNKTYQRSLAQAVRRDVYDELIKLAEDLGIVSFQDIKLQGCFVRALAIKQGRFDEVLESQSQFRIAQNLGLFGLTYEAVLRSLKDYQQTRPYKLADGYDNLMDALLGVTRSENRYRRGLNVLIIAEQYGLIDTTELNHLIDEFDHRVRQSQRRGRSLSPRKGRASGTVHQY